ncbi:unnamed protein product [Notodromas monacha]|uniref:RING-type E3 ubiquitin transferase n=1 Tax=Notodromas monacha TaxID=399045 RepID=A0A7R9GD38_9CRUS|nr:unnamed protein product [Notodromas monacha]CAG0916575.1 unnamed protein product [Notodromas monacha]
MDLDIPLPEDTLNALKIPPPPPPLPPTPPSDILPPLPPEPAYIADPFPVALGNHVVPDPYVAGFVPHDYAGLVAAAPIVAPQANGDRYSPSKISSESESDEESANIYPPGEEGPADMILEKRKKSSKKLGKNTLLDKNQAKKRLMAFSVAKAMATGPRSKAFDEEPESAPKIAPPKMSQPLLAPSALPSAFSEKSEKVTVTLSKREPPKSMIESIMEEEMQEKAKVTSAQAHLASTMRRRRSRSSQRDIRRRSRSRDRRSSPRRQDSPESKPKLKALPRSWDEMKKLGASCDDLEEQRFRLDRLYANRTKRDRPSLNGDGDTQPTEDHDPDSFFRGYSARLNDLCEGFPPTSKLIFQPVYAGVNKSFKRSCLKSTCTKPNLLYAENPRFARPNYQTGQNMFEGNSIAVNRLMRMIIEGVGLPEKFAHTEPSRKFNWYISNPSEMVSSHPLSCEMEYNAAELGDPAIPSAYDHVTELKLQVEHSKQVPVVKSRWDSDNEDSGPPSYPVITEKNADERRLPDVDDDAGAIKRKHKKHDKERRKARKSSDDDTYEEDEKWEEKHVSPPLVPADEKINYDAQVSDMEIASSPENHPEASRDDIPRGADAGMDLGVAGPMLPPNAAQQISAEYDDFMGLITKDPEAQENLDQEKNFVEKDDRKSPKNASQSNRGAYDSEEENAWEVPNENRENNLSAGTTNATGKQDPEEDFTGDEMNVKVASSKSGKKKAKSRSRSKRKRSKSDNSSSEDESESRKLKKAKRKAEKSSSDDSDSSEGKRKVKRSKKRRKRETSESSSSEEESSSDEKAKKKRKKRKKASKSKKKSKARHRDSSSSSSADDSDSSDEDGEPGEKSKKSKRKKKSSKKEDSSKKSKKAKAKKRKRKTSSSSSASNEKESPVDSEGKNISAKEEENVVIEVPERVELYSPTQAFNSSSEDETPQPVGWKEVAPLEKPVKPSVEAPKIEVKLKLSRRSFTNDLFKESIFVSSEEIPLPPSPVKETPVNTLPKSPPHERAIDIPLPEAERSYTPPPRNKSVFPSREEESYTPPPKKNVDIPKKEIDSKKDENIPLPREVETRQKRASPSRKSESVSKEENKQRSPSRRRRPGARSRSRSKSPYSKDRKSASRLLLFNGAQSKPKEAGMGHQETLAERHRTVVEALVVPRRSPSFERKPHRGLVRVVPEAAVAAGIGRVPSTRGLIRLVVDLEAQQRDQSVTTSEVSGNLRRDGEDEVSLRSVVGLVYCSLVNAQPRTPSDSPKHAPSSPQAFNVSGPKTPTSTPPPEASEDMALVEPEEAEPEAVSISAIPVIGQSVDGYFNEFAEWPPPSAWDQKVDDHPEVDPEEVKRAETKQQILQAYPSVAEEAPLSQRMEAELDIVVDRQTDDNRSVLYLRMEAVQNPYNCEFHRVNYDRFLSPLPPGGTCSAHQTNLCMYVAEKTPGGNPYMKARRAGKFMPKDLPPSPPLMADVFAAFPTTKGEVKQVGNLLEIVPTVKEEIKESVSTIPDVVAEGNPSFGAQVGESQVIAVKLHRVGTQTTDDDFIKGDDAKETSQEKEKKNPDIAGTPSIDSTANVKPKRRKKRKKKEKRVMRPVPLPPPPSKGILISAGFCEPSEHAKRFGGGARFVKFADGLRPGEGSTPEHDDERVSSPPPLHSACTYDRDEYEGSGLDDDDDGASTDREWSSSDEAVDKKPWEVDANNEDEFADDQDNGKCPPPPGNPSLETISLQHALHFYQAHQEWVTFDRALKTGKLPFTEEKLNARGYAYYHNYAKYVCSWLATAMKIKMKQYVLRATGTCSTGGIEGAANGDLVATGHEPWPVDSSSVSNSPVDVVAPTPAAVVSVA